MRASHPSIRTRWGHRVKPLLITLGVLVLLSSGVSAVSHQHDAEAAVPQTTLALSPVADTYVTSAAPTYVWGTTNQIQASSQPGHNKTAYVSFRIPSLAGESVVSAELVLVRTNHHLSGTVQARQVSASTWSERTMTARTAPAVGTVLDSRSTNAATSTVTFNVAKAVVDNSVITVGITSPSTTDFAAFRSHEWGTGGPQLRLTMSKASSIGSTPSPSSSAPTQSASPTSAAPTTSAPTPRPSDPSSTPPPIPTTSASSTTSAPPTPPKPSGTCASTIGIPSSGAYMGAAVTGTPTLAGLEQQVGRPIAIHRMYFAASQVAYAITAVKADLAAGRLPWISFKLPYSWADMAAGMGDAWTIDLANKLANVGGPVWLAFHHEPEGDGPIQDWVRMQQHLSPIIHAHTKNVAYTVIYTGYDVLFGPAQYSLNAIWPGDQYVDVAGFDVYNDYMSGRNGNWSIPMLDPMKYFSIIGPWAKQHHVNWGVAETGFTAAAAQKDPQWLQTEYNNLVSAGGSALTYFDSTLNSIVDWSLSDSTRMNAFTRVMPQTARIC